MNSLEFIEKEIEYEKNNIKLWTPKEKTSKRLEYLQHIKNELEAWKVLKSSKRYTMYNKDIDTGIIMKKITFIFEDKGDDCIVKKALEVKENDTYK